MVGDMENYKIKVNNESESKEVQELFFELGYKKAKSCRWLIDCIIDYFATDGDELHCWDSEKHGEKRFNSLPHKQITLQYLRDLVVLKRNDVNDATHETNGYKFYVSEDSVFEYIGGWKDASEYIEDFNLNPIEKKEMKEFLNSEQGYALVECFVGETATPKSWIEVPEGAEILYFDKRYKSSNHFFKTVDGKSYYKYLENGSEWVGYDIEGLDEFKDNIDNFRIMWKRNTTTPNALIQEKLKFIEKWLNGEKIQYILGIESEKTQWHNFTEGAMQYIKRPDIKFREAPKYVTINGIEFKNIESILNYIKSNFDLEDGE